MGSRNKIAFYPELGLAEIVRLSRRFKATKGVPAEYSVRVAILSNFSTQFLAMALPLALQSRGIDVDIYEAGYNQWEQELLDPNGAILAFRPDIVLLTLTSSLLQLREDSSDPARFSENLSQLIEAVSKRLPSRFVVTLPEPLEEEYEQTGWAYAWRHRLAEELRTKLEGRAVLVDLEPLIIHIGALAWYSSRFLVTKKLPANPQTTAYHADYLAQTITSIVKRQVRLVVVDLDNTLWGGVVGELGWKGVHLDPEGDGFAYLRLQRFLLGLRERGVLLAVSSKNNPEDALAVFRRRPEMILREEHFADMRINWEPKSSNINAILKTLNLTATGTVFIDDSPFERGEVGAALPEVFAPDFPPDPVDLVSMLARTGLFSLPLAGHEDLQRNEQYMQERHRQNAASTTENLDEYYRTLKLTLVPRQLLKGDDFERVVDLLAKTNQFNLTTRRYGRSDIYDILDEGGTEIWTYALSDRFGEYGVIAVVITRSCGEDLVIDTWAMSCRAMGRTVERAIFRHIFDCAQAAHRSRIVGDYIASQKNKPVENLYPQLGFKMLPVSPEGIRFGYVEFGKEPANEFVSIRLEERELGNC